MGGKSPPFTARRLNSLDFALYLVRPIWSDQKTDYFPMSANNTLSNEIAAELRREILTGHYREGDRLASERDLASRFGASRGAVREALSQLEQIGLIDIQLGGARVQPIGQARIAVLGPLMALGEAPDPALVAQFLQTFGALAALTMEQAVSRSDQAQMNRLQAYVVELEGLVDDFAAMQEKWREFFLCVRDISDNLVVQLIGNDLKAQFVDQVVNPAVRPVIAKPMMRKILASLKQGLDQKDSEKVGATVRQYFEELSLATTQAIGQMPALMRQKAS